MVKKKNSYLGYCGVCNTDLKLGKSGKSELIKHSNTKKHKSNIEAEGSTSNTLDHFLQGGFTDQTKLLEARICTFLVENDLAISKVEPFVAFLKKIAFKASSGECATQETESYQCYTNRTKWFL